MGNPVLHSLLCSFVYAGAERVIMQNKLKKQLEFLKKRARRFMRNGEEALKRNDIYNSGSQNGPAYEAAGIEDLLRDEPGPVALEEAVAGREDMTPSGGYYLIEADVETLDSSASIQAADLTRNIRAGCMDDVFGRSPRSFSGIIPERVGFLDIETTGLSPSTYVFLGGVMFIKNSRLCLEQFFGRDYPEESAMLHKLAGALNRFDAVVTYNGISFDLPFIRTRMAVHKLDFDEGFATLDLLGPSRRTFSRALPNCKLETVRKHLTGFDRVGDVPGRLVPAVYHDFVNTSNASLIKGVIYHNQMDLFAMVVVLNALAENRGL